MFRFFVNRKVDNHFVLSKDQINHLKVVRAIDENFICVFEGVFYICKLEANMARIIEIKNENHERSSQVILAAGIIETKNWELVIQKATELGVTQIIPLKTTNTSKKIPDIDAKVERWRKITLAAAEQSFRNFVPEILMPQTLSEVLTIDIKNKFLAHEKADEESAFNLPSNSLLLVGPEGGFTDDEVNYAKTQNVKIISLGKRILRAETASLVLLARVLD